MGVKSCDRYGCTNIMCEKTVAQGRYYVCWTCFDELRRWIQAIDFSQLTVEGAKDEVAAFFDSDKTPTFNNSAYPEVAREFERLLED